MYMYYKYFYFCFKKYWKEFRLFFNLILKIYKKNLYVRFIIVLLIKCYI